jgi:membrane fusion protein (multidrug efflux system)
MLASIARRRALACVAAVAAALGLTACGPSDVVVSRAGPATITAQPGGVGVVAAAVSIPVSVDVRDVITSVEVQPGDHVTQGQPLFDIDPTPLQQAQATLALRLQSIQASIAVARASLRVQQAKGSPQVSAIEDEISALQGEATVEQQLIQISSGKAPTVTAPANGDVQSVAATPGLQATPGQSLVVIIDYTSITATANLPIAEQEQVHISDHALISFPTLPNITLQGQVTSVSPAATNNGVSFQVTVAAANTPDKAVRPNLQAYVRVSVTHQASVAVSKLAIVNIDFNPTVFVVDGGVAHMRQVRIGISDQGKVELLGGVQAGDLCVIVGNQSLQDGTSVKVIQTS